MVASEVLSYLASWHVETQHGMNDFSDNLISTYTLMLLLVFAGLVTMKTYVFRPIVCYTSNRMDGGGLEAYVENYCWVNGMVPITSDKVKTEFPQNEEDWNALLGNRMLYYQWVPLILGLLAIGCYVPRLVWRIFYLNRSGTDYEHLLDLATEAQRQGSQPERNKLVQQVVFVILDVLGKNREWREGCAARCRLRFFSALSFGFLSKRFGSWVVCAYLLVKIMSIAYALLALTFLHHCLGFSSTNYTLFGIQVLLDLAQGRSWQQTAIFPRVAFCRVAFKHVGNMNALTAQCAVPANMLNEVVFVFLWFWLIMLLIASSLSLLRWIPRCLSLRKRKAFIRKFLHFSEQSRDAPPLAVRVFVENFLLHDGVFLLRMMAYNVGSRVTTDVVLELWSAFCAVDDWAELHRPYRRLPSPPQRSNAADFAILPMTKGGSVRQRRPSRIMTFPDARPSAPPAPSKESRSRTLSTTSSNDCAPPPLPPPPPHSVLNMDGDKDSVYPNLDEKK